MKKALLITDLDNTLYDWVTYFCTSFGAMISELSILLEVPVEVLHGEFKAVHQKHGNSEHPFSILEIPSVTEHFRGLSNAELIDHLAKPLHAFNSARKKSLHLYPGAFDTLKQLKDQGVKVVAHTEAQALNSFYRLKRLEIIDFFAKLYTIQGTDVSHPIPGRELYLPPNFITILPREERKPNPQLLIDICKKENVSPANAVYVGDSLTRDMAMAVQAGVYSVWAEYGHSYDPGCWNELVKITHWTDDDVKREKRLKEMFSEVKPDLKISCFSELLPLFN